MIDGVVKQLSNGQVIECSAVTICMKENADIVERKLCGGVKHCQLSVDHGGRCYAYPSDSYIWLIDIDTSKIKQLPTV